MAELLQPKILVAEDDRAIRELLDIRLSLAGYRVATAKDGQEAIEHLAGHPRALLLDLNMPRLDGFGVLEWMGRYGLFKACPVMMLTCRNAREDVQRCLQLGAKDYLSKPFNDTILLARVSRLLRTVQPKPQGDPRQSTVID